MKEIEVIYEIVKSAVENNQEKMINNIKLFAKKLKENGHIEESNLFFDLIGTNKVEVSVSSLYHSSEILKLNILDDYDNNIELSNYVDPLDDIDSTNNFIDVIKNKTNRINKNIKVLIYGRPGTGKTTYSKFIAKMACKKIYIVKASKLISSFLGDTQKT